MNFKQRYTEFLNTLEDITEIHDELTDTDVRERMHEVINWYFVWGNPMDSEFPQRYAMFSLEGDNLVAEAVRSFVEDSCRIGTNLEIGVERNTALEDPSIETQGGNSYDCFLGSSDDPVPGDRPSSDLIYGDYED